MNKKIVYCIFTIIVIALLIIGFNLIKNKDNAENEDKNIIKENDKQLQIIDDQEEAINM